jgi:hypothetical protein
MTRDEYLHEVQRRIAEEKGYKHLQTHPGGSMSGVLHADEGSTIVPRWPWGWCDAGVLVTEMEQYPFWWSAHRSGSIHGTGGLAPVYTFAALPGLSGLGNTLEESIARCWCAWKGVDLSDLPPVAP